MQTSKSGIRILGIAESFSQGANNSLFAGVVMRKDLIIDGFAFSHATVGGMDATDAVIGIFDKLNRRDINCIVLSGCVVSWFNIIDPDLIFKTTNVPVIGVTYEDSKGLKEHIIHHFPGDENRLSAYEKLGERTFVKLDNKYGIYIRTAGLLKEEAFSICNSFAKEGKIPEPLRVARLLARSFFKDENRSNILNIS
ncbi:DUF99 family protein [Methanoplanus sp. FWC-SCC4]|uniref:UPF0215 protein F1737_04780 n=1 Tax=Methanochimaera problematica TaxID=2609417 RepID=A0AA97FD78_9EURY|nr:DUF99 family protein [Methanoplanus sp. FWC-SCC4]WOF16068.1 DUF99 family protein [Methanoplanus sp. FWC-SCC4]